MYRAVGMEGERDNKIKRERVRGEETREMQLMESVTITLN